VITADTTPPGTPPPSPPPPQPHPPTGPGRPFRMVMGDGKWPPKEPFPKGARGSCMVGELLVPLFGRRWVDEVAAAGGLVLWLGRRLLAALFPARSPRSLLLSALLRETGELSR
jgi:hypothetical protein